MPSVPENYSAEFPLSPARHVVTQVLSVLLGSLLKNISYIIGTNIIPLIICTHNFFELKQLCFIRYRVAMLVVAREDSAVFVAFDASMTKLTNVMAVEVANQWCINSS